MYFALAEAKAKFPWNPQQQGPQQIPYETSDAAWFWEVFPETQPRVDSSSPSEDRLRCLASRNKYFPDDDFLAGFSPQIPGFGPTAHMTLPYKQPVNPTSWYLPLCVILLA